MNSHQLYNRFHKISLKHHFGIEAGDLEHLKKYKSFDEFIKQLNPEQEKKCQEIRYTYEHLTAPDEKLSNLTIYLEREGLSPINYLDFGSGSNSSSLKYMNQRYSFARSVGVETNADQQEKKAHSIEIYPDLNSVKANGFELVTILHVLHHINPLHYHEVMANIKGKMSQHSILYLMEDSWYNQTDQNDQDELSKTFNNLSTEEKVAFFQLNEYWSNGWFYKRTFNYSETSYLDISSWQYFLRSCGFEIIQSGYTGINLNRIHGVPAGWVIAKKAD